MSRIFISYRRDDTAGHAGRLFDRLCARLGKRSVFMDVDGIEAGLDFVEAIEAAVGSCDVLLAVIGRGWLDMKDSQGRRRLDDPRDFIRLETATALDRHIRVIPVLVEGAAMPAEESLPEVLRSLARRQAVDLRDSRWDADIENLMQVLERVLAMPPAPAPAPTPPPAAAASKASEPVAEKPVDEANEADDSRHPRGLWLAAVAALVVLGAGIAYFIGAGGRSKALEATHATSPAAAPAATPAATPIAKPAMPAPAPIAAAEKSAAPPAPPVEPKVEPKVMAPIAHEKAAPAKAEPAKPRPARVPSVVPAEAPAVDKRPAPLAKAPIQAPAAVPLPPVVPVGALKIIVVAMGETTSRSFWGGERVPAYSAKMAALYDGTLHRQAQGRIDVQAGRDAAQAKPLLDGSPKAAQQLCDSTGAAVIFAAHAQQGFSLSQIESAYFPELRLGAIACASGKRHVSSYNLSPRNDDAFPFAHDMAQAMGDFVREKLPLVQ